MRRHAKASSVGSSNGNAMLARSIAVFALATAALAIIAAPAFGSGGFQVLNDPPDEVSYTSVKVSGTVKEDAANISNVEFRQSTDGVNFPSKGDTAYSYFVGEAVHEVEREYVGLKPGTHYYLQIWTFGPGDPYVQSNVVEVTTLPVAKPTALSATDATDVSYTTAKASGEVHGVVGPDPAFDSECRFEYVTDARFAEKGFEVEPEEALPSAPCNEPITGEDPTPVTADFSGLTPGTTYHLRVTISNGGGSDSKEAAGTFTTLPVDPPTVLSVDDATNVAYTQAEVTGEIERPAGPDPAFDAHCRVEYVTADQFTNNAFAEATRVECDPEAVTSPDSSPVSAPVKAKLTGLAVGTTYYMRIVASNSGGSDSKEATNTFTTLTPGAPIVSILAPTDVTATSAHFSGTIDPDGTDPGFNVDWHFECNPECPGLEGGTIEAESASPPVTVEANATGLKANTTYEVTLVATNAGEQATAGPEQFTTVAVKPIVTTFPAFAFPGGTRALVGGRIDPENSQTKYWIEYGPDTNYGSSIPLSEDASAGAGDDSVFVTQELSGLQPQATYHFCLVAANQVGTVQGADLTFTVLSTEGLGSSIGKGSLPEDRAWEMVSPPDKNNADVWKTNVTSSVSGDALYFQSQGSFAGQPTARGGLLTDYLSKRSSTSWTTQGITPPGGVFGLSNVGTFGASDDLRYTEIGRREQGNETLDPEADVSQFGSAPVFRDYIRDNASGTYRLLPDFVGSSNDYSHVVLQTGEELTSDSPCKNFFFCVYETVGREAPRLVSILPNGEPYFGEYLGISKDGSRVFWTDFEGHVLVRVDGEETIQIAGGASLAAVGAPSGERALVISNEALVAEDDDSANDLYLWDEGKPEGERHTLISKGDLPGVAAQVGGVLGNQLDQFNARKELERGYFRADNQILAGQPDAPGAKIYSWEANGSDVTLKYVATSDSSNARVSPNGRFLAFISSDRLTAYDNAGQPEIYRYDSDAGQLVCASCEPEGNQPTAPAMFDFFTATEEAAGPSHLLRNLDDDGEVFFMTTEALVPRDSNGQRDVYEYVDGLPRLISTGTGQAESRLVAVSESGDDVFFVTAERLRGWDVDGLYDVYDARVDGGLPEPPPGVIGCDGDACQSVPPAPNDPTPSSATFNGPGSPHKKKPKKSKRVKKRHHKKQKQAKRRHAKHKTQRHG